MDLIRELTTDHRKVIMLLSSINSVLFGETSAYFTEGRKSELTGAVIELLHELTRTLLKHEQIEQRVLFPALMDRLPAMVHTIRTVNNEHGGTLKILTELEQLLLESKSASNHHIIDRFLDLQKHLDLHILKEEIEIFEPARVNIPAKELASLGSQALAAQ